MKKVLAMVLALMMVLSVGVVAFANGGFVSSPSNELAPSVDDVASSSGASIDVGITSYTNKGTLPAEAEAEMTEAYDSIKKEKDLTKLCEDLADLAVELDVPGEKLAVSDLFDISPEGFDKDEHGNITLKLKVDEEIAEKFVALLHFKDGEWEVVEGAKIVDGKLVFSSDDFSPFAIVIDTTTKPAEMPIIESIIRLLKSVFGLFR